MRKLFTGVLAVLLCTAFAAAEGTHTWEQTKFEDFEKGTNKGVAIRSDGRLVLAPSFSALYTTPSTYIWAIAADNNSVYVAAGAPARVYRVTPDGQARVIFQPQELQVQSLIVDKSGAIYAATSPDGKVYKIQKGKSGEESTAAEKAVKVPDKKAADQSAAEAHQKEVPVDPSYTSSVFFDPKTKYIWSMALDRDGRLYVATGDHGEIFRVEPNGKNDLFFKSDEAHIRALAFDNKGNVIAGSDGSGLVYRITPAGEGFVLYSAPKKEITALAVDDRGNIYAAGVGEKRGGPNPAFGGAVVNPTPAPAPLITGQAQINIFSNPGAPFPGNMPMPGAGATGGSEIYQIATDGSPKRLWKSTEDIVYALAVQSPGHLLAGTGNRGRIFAISSDDTYTDLLKASASQVTAFAQAPDGGFYASTSNLGKVFRMGAAPDSEGTFESDVFDAHIFSKWGRIEVRGAGNFEIYARSGNVDNPDRNWSPWKRVDLGRGGEVDTPAARFIQWKAVLKPGNSPAVVDSVLVNYRPKNVAPEIEDVTVQVGARFQPTPKPMGGGEMINVGPSNMAQQPRFEAPTPAMRDRDSVAVRWSAHDDNDDQLEYTVYYRGDGETRWKLLKDKINDKFYSFDSALLPDGGYTVRVVASDAPSHTPDEALTAERESSRFEVDTTPPQVQDLHASVDNGEIHITFRASDTFSPIKRAEYSIDAGDWQFVEPVGQLSDAKVENYDFAIPTPGQEPVVVAQGAADPPEPAVRTKNDRRRRQVQPLTSSQEHVVVVRVYDRFENMGAAKTVIHASK